MWMVAWVHSRATHGRSASHMPGTSGFPDAAVLVVDVAHLSNSRHTENMDTALLAGRQTQQGVVALFCHQLCACTGTPCHLSTASPLYLNTMHGGTCRNVLEWQSISWLDISLWTCRHAITDF